MDVGSITTLISSVGFPIAACVAIWWKSNKDTEAHAEEVKSLSAAINNNTVALTQLVDKLGSDGK